MKNMRNRSGRKKDPNPRRRALRIHLDEEDFNRLEKGSDRNRTWQAEVLLSNAIRASWAYDSGRICVADDRPAVEAARDFFGELYHLQAAAREAIELSHITAMKALGEAAKRCQQWLDAEKVRRASDVALENRRPVHVQVLSGKVLRGKRSSARKAATS